MAVLPPDVFGPILKDIVRNEGERALLNLRLVSKAWNAAVKEAFRGSIQVSAHEDLRSVFEDIQKAVPNLSRLEISSKTQCDLRRVLGFSGLSSLELNSDAHRGSDPEPENLILDLRMLPASLMDLETVCYNVDPDSFEQVRCTHLTTLAIIDVQLQPAQICQLLNNLPALKVSAFKGERVCLPWRVRLGHVQVVMSLQGPSYCCICDCRI